jgi:hypothetical protein
MKPSRDRSGVVTVKLTETEIKKLQGAWPVLEQLAYHLRQSGKFNGVDVREIGQTAAMIAALACDKAKTE